MKLVNIDENLAKKYFEADNKLLYITLVPYKNNTCIKAYTEEKEPIGDVEESFVQEYLTKDKEVMFINEVFNDDTGLIEYTISTMF